jgi:hypothetical protein
MKMERAVEQSRYTSVRANAGVISEVLLLSLKKCLSNSAVIENRLTRYLGVLREPCPHPVSEYGARFLARHDLTNEEFEGKCLPSESNQATQEIHQN